MNDRSGQKSLCVETQLAASSQSPRGKGSSADKATPSDVRPGWNHALPKVKRRGGPKLHSQDQKRMARNGDWHFDNNVTKWLMEKPAKNR